MSDGTLDPCARLLRLRWGVLSGLRVGAVDFDRNRVEVKHTVVECAG